MLTAVSGRARGRDLRVEPPVDEDQLGGEVGRGGRGEHPLDEERDVLDLAEGRDDDADIDAAGGHAI